MSRLIVKNLPSGIKEDRFRDLFAAFGTLTDCSLKYTKEGKFRKFGFIGFGSEDEAREALSHFNKSFIDTSRVSVELCKSFGDPGKSKAWSKHSQREAKAQDSGKKQGTKQTPADPKTPKKQKATALEELEGDNDFKEFLSVHQNRTTTATWSNDTQEVGIRKEKSRSRDDYLNFDSDSESGVSEEEGGEDDSPNATGEDAAGKLALRLEISDMEYLKSKVVKDPSPTSGEEEEEEEETETPEGEKVAAQSKPAGKGKSQGSSEKSKVAKKEKPAVPNSPTTPYTVKLRGAPFNVTEQNVREFLVPIKPVAIRIVRNTHGNKTGYIFVDLSSEEAVQKALTRNKDYMGEEVGLSDHGR
ncbi:hypothetical protein FKM82_021097 [Ascaphus truei]